MLPSYSFGEYNIIAFSEFIKQFIYVIRIILQITIHDDYPLSVRHIHPGFNRIVLANVLRKFQTDYPGILLRHGADDLPWFSRSAVIDQNKLEIFRNRADRSNSPTIQRHQGDIASIDRHNNGHIRISSHQEPLAND